MAYVTLDELFFSATRFPKGATVSGEFYLGPKSGPQNELQRQVSAAIDAGLIVPQQTAKRRGRAKKDGDATE